MAVTHTKVSAIVDSADTSIVRPVDWNAAHATDLSDYTGWIQWAGQKRTTAQFDKTDTTLTNITGLSVNVTAGDTYQFCATLFTSQDGTGLGKVAIAGTATATAIIYARSERDDVPASSLGSAILVAGTAITIVVVGTITVNAGGTLTVQYAQQVALGTSSVLSGSTFIVNEIA